jgi:hypothetical protein
LQIEQDICLVLECLSDRSDGGPVDLLRLHGRCEIKGDVDDQASLARFVDQSLETRQLTAIEGSIIVHHPCGGS